MGERWWRCLFIWGLKHPRTLVCDGMATATSTVCFKHSMCHLLNIGIVSVGRWLNLWHKHTIVSICGKSDLTKYAYVIQLPNHTSTRCPSWSCDLIYDIVWVCCDSHQERNALIPHLHEHDNLRDSWQSPLGALIRMSGAEARSYHNHKSKTCVRMRNIQMKVL